MKRSLAILSMLTFSATAFAVEAKVVSCDAAQDKRTIEIKKNGESGCEVIYTRDNTPKTVFQANHESDKCEAMVQRIVGKLEGSSFKCTGK